MGLLTRNIKISHSNQNSVYFVTDFKGTGIGTIINLSHYDLRFVPEILSRTVKVKNESGNEVTIVSVSKDPLGHYKLSSPLPMPIHAQDSVDLTFSWDGVAGSDVQFDIDAAPCAFTKSVVLGSFSGTSTLTLPAVEADPRGDAVIPISYINKDNKPYNGVRFYEGKIEINPRIFLPLSIKSEYGQSQITSNEIVNDKRIISYRVEGNFPNSGILAEISGVAGLAETDLSPISPSANSLDWGKSVAVTTLPGSFHLINLCGNRRVVQNAAKAKIQNIMPNPVADGMLFVEVDCEDKCSARFEVLDETAATAVVQSEILMQKGISTVALDVSKLSEGFYRLCVKSDAGVDIISFVVLR